MFFQQLFIPGRHGKLLPARFSATETQPQGIVMSHKVSEYSIQDLSVEFLSGLEHNCLVPMMSVGQILFEEPLLNGRQMDFSGNDSRLSFRSPGWRKRSGEGGDGPMSKNQPRSKSDAQVIGAVSNLDTQDRIAAECEKVVVNSDALEAKGFGPQT